jgi:tripartite-type tricarboxylate transporter receptor subunit TctC
VVPFGAGGLGRSARADPRDHMQAKFGQTVVVENRAGAGGSIGTNYVAKAAPDGYTLLLGTVSSIAVNAALYRQAAVRRRQGLQPITQLVSFPNLLIVNPKLPIKNVQELIDYVKKNEGKVNYASSGLGTSSHLSVVMFEQAIGTKMTHVPYKSTGDVVNSMLGGNVDIAIDSMTTVWPHAKQGTVRALGVSHAAAQRLGARGAGDRRDHQGLRSDRLAGPVRAGRHTEARSSTRSRPSEAHLEPAGGEGSAQQLPAPIPCCPTAPRPSPPSRASSG